MLKFDEDDRMKNKLEQELTIESLFFIIFILFFCAHIFIEVQPRYRYDQYVMLALISGKAINYILNQKEQLKEKLKLK